MKTSSSEKFAVEVRLCRPINDEQLQELIGIIRDLVNEMKEKTFKEGREVHASWHCDLLEEGEENNPRHFKGEIFFDCIDNTIHVRRRLITELKDIDAMLDSINDELNSKNIIEYRYD